MTTMHADQVRAKLLGAWHPVTCESVDTDGTVSYPMGNDVAGQLMYDASGRVSAQLVRPDQPPFASEDWRQASPAEMIAAWPNYFGYYGTFTIDADARTVTHHIDYGWFPNLAGTEQVRNYRFDDHRLVLDADTAWGKVRVICERCR
jgi:lipocalin-like protein